MGGQQSTRRVTIDNDEPALITVSTNVVDRLNNQASRGPPRPAPEVHERPVSGRSFAASDFVHAGDELKYKGLPYVTTREIQKALDEEIKKNSEYWENRLAKQKDAYEKTNRILEDEYLRASEQMDKYLPKVNEEKPIVDCNEKSQQIVACLKKNKGQPLLCSNEVQAFNSCIQDARSQRKL